MELFSSLKPQGLDIDPFLHTLENVGGTGVCQVYCQFILDQTFQCLALEFFLLLLKEMESFKIVKI